MNPRQLELELELTLEDAAEMPALANLHNLWQQMEPVIAELPVRDQLRVGGVVLDQLAELHRAKAELLLEDWENRHNPQDPALPNDWLQGLVRQTQYVDFSELTAPVKRRPRGKASKVSSEGNTIVGEVSKVNLLKMLDQVDQETQKIEALSVAHEESVQAWVAAIAEWFKHHPQPISLLQLQKILQWSLVKLWLSLLLGGFRLETMNDEFYSSLILVYRD